MKKLRAAVLGATGTVGQRICHMLRDHPWFEVSNLTGGASAGKLYGEAVNWLLPTSIPEKLVDMSIEPSKPEKVVDADFVFSALPSGVAWEIEPVFAGAGFAVVSNASAFRMSLDVPLVVPEVNADHIELIEHQRLNRGWDGFLSTDPNCSTINFVLALKPLYDAFTIKKVIVTTMQAVSGAGYPGVPSLSIIDNVIPYIEREEEKMQNETQKILGKLKDGAVENAPFDVAAACNRIPVVDGHLETVYIEVEEEIDLNEAREKLRNFRGTSKDLELPTAPEKPILVTEEADRPQTRLDRMAGSVPGMSVTVGRLRHGIDKRSMQLVVLGHNTIRGAAGATIQLAELLYAKGWISR